VPQQEPSHQPYSTHRKPDFKYSANLFNQNSPQEFSLDVNFRPLPQDVSKLSDTKEKLSRYLQAIEALSSAAVGSGSTHVIQRPTLQSFATDLGIVLSPTRDHRFEVRSIVSNTPASKRNVNVGDLLLAIDREPVALKSPEEVCELLGRPSMLFRVSLFFLIVSLHRLCFLHRN
jgi:C-terminal processing protease CtpA/Prc